MAAEIVAASAPTRSWVSGLTARWGSDRSALSVDTFRVFVGAFVVLHFGRAWGDLSDAIGHEGLYVPARGFDTAWLEAFRWSEDHGSWGRLVAITGCLLGLAIMGGIAPRVAAALLFLLATWVHRVAFAVSTLDDALVGIVAFWLCILPVGRTLCVGDIRQQKAWTSRRVEGWTSQLFLVHLFLVHADVGLWRDYAPLWAPSTLSVALLGAVPLALVVPAAGVRIGAIGGLLALHSFLGRISGLVFAHGIMVASIPLLLWNGRGGSAGDVAPARRPFSVGAATGLVVIVVTLIAGGGRWLSLRTPNQPRPWAQAAATVLRDAGVLVDGAGRHLPPSPLRLEFESEKSVETLRFASLRPRVLLSYLATREPSARNVRQEVAEGVVRIHCRDGRTESGRMRLAAEGIVDKIEVGNYRCTRDSSAFSVEF